MELKERDRIEAAVEILDGIRDICIIFEEVRGKELPLGVFVVLETALEKAGRLLKELYADM
ncbi:hypothetical protein AALB53_22350 [Lachnospiraceae bacterium 47-T17]